MGLGLGPGHLGHPVAHGVGDGAVPGAGLLERALLRVREPEHRPELGLLVITHYQRLLDEIRPTHVHLLIDGRIAESGGMELATRLEAEGYEAWRTPVAP